MIHPLFSLYSLNISFAFISHSYKPYKHLFSALLLDILCFILYSRFIMIVANHILVYKNSTLINSLRVNKFFFTRKEIFTYTQKKNYLHVKNLAVWCFDKIKVQRKQCNVRYNTKQQCVRNKLRIRLKKVGNMQETSGRYVETGREHVKKWAEDM